MKVGGRQFMFFIFNLYANGVHGQVNIPMLSSHNHQSRSAREFAHSKEAMIRSRSLC